MTVGLVLTDTRQAAGGARKDPTGPATCLCLQKNPAAGFKSLHDAHHWIPVVAFVRIYSKDTS